MPDKEVMPLIINVLSNKPLTSPETHLFTFEEMELNKKAQRDADQKVLMHEVQSCMDTEADIMADRKKNWARKEAEYLSKIIERPHTSEELFVQLATHIAQLHRGE